MTISAITWLLLPSDSSIQRFSTYVVIAYIIMAYIVMAYIVMAYIVMAVGLHPAVQHRGRTSAAALLVERDAVEVPARTQPAAVVAHLFKKK